MAGAWLLGWTTTERANFIPVLPALHYSLSHQHTQPGAPGDFPQNIIQSPDLSYTWQKIISLLPSVLIKVPEAPSHKGKNGNKICSLRRNTRSAGGLGWGGLPDWTLSRLNISYLKCQVLLSAKTSGRELHDKETGNKFKISPTVVETGQETGQDPCRSWMSMFKLRVDSTCLGTCGLAQARRSLLFDCCYWILFCK